MSLHFSSIAKSSVATASVAAVQSTGTIEIDAGLYTVLACALALVGILLSRLVTIDAENRRLGRRQTWRETGPLTWIAVLIVCPLIWHYKVAVPWAALIGLGVGYSVRIILRILGDASANAARAVAERTVDALRNAPAPQPGLPPDMEDLLDQIDRKTPE